MRLLVGPGTVAVMAEDKDTAAAVDALHRTIRHYAFVVVVVAVTALVVWRVYTLIRGADARAREWVECDQVDC